MAVIVAILLVPYHMEVLVGDRHRRLVDREVIDWRHPLRKAPRNDGDQIRVADDRRYRPDFVDEIDHAPLPGTGHDVAVNVGMCAQFVDQPHLTERHEGLHTEGLADGGMSLAGNDDVSDRANRFDDQPGNAAWIGIAS